MSSPTPASEAARLEALRSYGILDTGSEAALDDLAALAAHACGTPVALLTLVDRDRQWVKSAVGIELREMPRDLSVCTHAIRQRSVLVVPDLAADPRFADNPVLRGRIGARFYAGAPLVTPGGHALGTMCVLDRRPRELAPQQAEALERLARQAIAQMELLRSLRTITRHTAELDETRARHARTGSLLQATLESTADALVAVDLDGRFITFNQAFAELWDLPADVLAHRDDGLAVRYVLSRVKDPAAFEAAVAEIYRNPEAESHHLVELADGRVIERDSRPQRLDGRVVGRVWSFRDVTERSRAEEAIRAARLELEDRVASRTAELGEAVHALQAEILERERAEAELRFQTTLLEAQNHTAIDGILVTHEGRVLSMNERFAELFDVPAELRSRERGVDLLRWARSQAADPVAYRARVEALRADAEAVGRDEVLLADGRVLDRYTAPLRSADGRYYGRIWVVRDITDRKRTEVELRAAKEEAERANLAKSEFLSRMSHELRTPLNSILGFAQLLARQPLPPVHTRGVEHILKAGRHLLNLINEVLDIARIEANRQQFSLEPVNVGTSLQEALSLIRPLAAQHGCEVEDVRPGPPLFARADRQRLTQVLLNLLSNAVKYNRPGGRVWLTTERDGERVRLGVHDTGRGIPAELQGELFTPFARLGAEQSGVEGTGLGLALSLRLVEAMGGSLGVESVPGEGSVFRVELPLAEDPLARLETTRWPALVAEPSAPEGPPRTVLYIEDNLANWTLVETILAGRPSVQLLPALQGRLGLELAREHLPDLVLLDLHLPDLPGEAVLRELRADPRTRAIPVLVISADATLHQIERLRAAGAHGYLTKPLDVDEFLAAVDGVLATLKC